MLGSTVRLLTFCLWLTEGDTRLVCTPPSPGETSLGDRTLLHLLKRRRRSSSVCRDHGETRGRCPPRATGGLPARVPGMRRASGQSASSPMGWPNFRKVAFGQRARARLCEGALSLTGTTKATRECLRGRGTRGPSATFAPLTGAVDVRTCVRQAPGERLVTTFVSHYSS